MENTFKLELSLKSTGNLMTALKTMRNYGYEALKIDSTTALYRIYPQDVLNILDFLQESEINFSISENK